MPRIRQHQSVFNPVIAQTGVAGEAQDTFWAAPSPKSLRGTAISSSGMVSGGDLSIPMPFPWLDEPKPKRPGLIATQQWFGGDTNLLITVPAITTGEWYQNFSQPRPRRPGLPAAEQEFQFATTQLIFVPSATTGELFPLFPPRSPKRPGLSAAEMQFATFVPPAVVAPPAGGGFQRRRRFVRRGRVF